MRIINWHIARNLIFTLLLALGVLAFIMLSAHFFRAFSLLGKGASPVMLLRMIGMLMPDVLRYAMPLAMLVATVLVFSRMSADDEITALRASGISLWQIVAPGLLLAILLSALGLWLGFWVGPDMRYKSKQLEWMLLAADRPDALIEPGRTIKFGDQSIYVGRRDDNGLLHDVHITSVQQNGKMLMDITAATGGVSNNEEARRLDILLNDFTITYLPMQPKKAPAVSAAATATEKAVGTLMDTPQFVTGKSLILPWEYGQTRERKLERKLKMMPAEMLFGNLAWTRAQHKDTTKHWLEFHQRLALAFSPFAFLLLGIPFGIRNRRSETSAGLIICVILALFFYAFMLLADCLANRPACHPELIIWIPNLLFEALGLAFLAKKA